MTEPMISWRPGWVSEWDGNILVCVREDHASTARPPLVPAEIAAEIAAAVPGNMPTARAILGAVCAEYGISFRRLCLRASAKSYVSDSVRWPRYDAIARLRAVTNPFGKPRYSWPQIAALVGRYDHTTCIAAFAKWQEIEAWIAGFDWPEQDAFQGVREAAA